MLRSVGLSIALVLAGLQETSAQDWAQKMFKVLSHDFGVVARGAKTEFAFELENLYAVDVHIAGVRTTCGCTKPQITKETLTTYEKGSILAVFNTDGFLGKRGATITVTIDKPRYAEVQLTVTGHIRSDIVIEPGGFAFGAVPQGDAAEKTARICYYGAKSDWRILEVRGASEYVEVELKPTRDRFQRPAYDMVARLKPTVTAGYFRDELTLVTNDPSASQVPVMAEGEIVAPITLSPASLFLGVIQPGGHVEKKLIVRGNQPFRIVSVHAGNDRFQFQFDDSAKKLHIIPVKFTAGEKTEKVVENIEVRTDLGEGATARCTASAAIVDSVAAK